MHRGSLPVVPFLRLLPAFAFLLIAVPAAAAAEAELAAQWEADAAELADREARFDARMADELSFDPEAFSLGGPGSIAESLLGSSTVTSYECQDESFRTFKSLGIYLPL